LENVKKKNCEVDRFTAEYNRLGALCIPVSLISLKHFKTHNIYRVYLNAWKNFKNEFFASKQRANINICPEMSVFFSFIVRLYSKINTLTL
jgi:hypothetical protein